MSVCVCRRVQVQFNLCLKDRQEELSVIQQGAEVYQGEWVVSMGVSPAAVLLWYVVRHWAGDRAIRLELSVELNCLKPHQGIQCLLLETDFRYLKRSTF